jgi:hypothetical protein
VLAVVLGIVVLFVQRAWPGPSRKYGAATAGAAADARAAVTQRDAVTDWDDLSAGTDPTEPTTERSGGAGPEPSSDGSSGAGPEPSADGERAGSVTVDAVGLGDGDRPTTPEQNEEHREQH